VAALRAASINPGAGAGAGQAQDLGPLPGVNFRGEMNLKVAFTCGALPSRGIEEMNLKVAFKFISLRT
jgi:hypothetical protein